MSDPIAEAAAQLSDAAPSSTEPQQPAPEVAPVGEPSSSLSSGGAGSGEAGNVAAGTPPAGAATPASTGNVLLNAAPVVDGPVIETAAAEPVPEAAEPLPRESHLMLLEAKFGAAVAKLRNAERVAVADLEAIWEHIQAVI